MDRKLARKNMRMGTGLFVLTIGLVCSTFLWATFYLASVK